MASRETPFASCEDARFLFRPQNYSPDSWEEIPFRNIIPITPWDFSHSIITKNCSKCIHAFIHRSSPLPLRFNRNHQVSPNQFQHWFGGLTSHSPANATSVLSPNPRKIPEMSRCSREISCSVRRKEDTVCKWFPGKWWSSARWNSRSNSFTILLVHWRAFRSCSTSREMILDKSETSLCLPLQTVFFKTYCSTVAQYLVRKLLIKIGRETNTGRIH